MLSDISKSNTMDKTLLSAFIKKMITLNGSRKEYHETTLIEMQRDAVRKP